MTNLEDQIIAYLDGTLDESSRAELLHTLSVSPEKRKLLEEHIKLREIISLGHKPQPVPLTTERKLADRIPLLMQELPYLAEKATRLAPAVGLRNTSYVSAAARYVSSFFTSRYAPALGLGSLVLMGGITWYLMSPSQEANVSELAKSRTANERVMDGASLNGSSLNGSSLNGSSSSVRNSEGTTNIVAPSDQQSVGFQDYATRSQLRIDRNARIERPTRNSASENANLRMNQNVSNSALLVNADAVSASEQTPASQHAENIANAPFVNTPSSNASSSNEASANGSASDVLSSNGSPSETPSPNVPPSEIKNPSVDPTPLPLPSENESKTGRWYAQAGVASDMNFRPNQQEQVYQAGAGKTSGVFGGGYEFTPHIAVGLEMGYSELSQQNEVITSSPNTYSGGSAPLSEVRRTEYNAKIVDVDAVWTQATLRYTLNPNDQYRIEAIGGAGAAYVDGIAPMVSLGLGGTYPISETFDLIMGATLRGAWLSDMAAATASEAIGSDGPVAVVSNRTSSSTVFTSAVSGRIGLRYGF